MPQQIAALMEFSVLLVELRRTSTFSTINMKRPAQISLDVNFALGACQAALSARRLTDSRNTFRGCACVARELWCLSYVMILHMLIVAVSM